MGQFVEVPITPSVLSWAIEQSGYSRDYLASRLGTSEVLLRDWERGKSFPGLSAFRQLAALLHRQAAVFFLDTPPARDGSAVIHLRRPPGTDRADLNPTERRFIREVRRYQRTLAWILEQLDTAEVELPRVRTVEKPQEVAKNLRARIGIEITTQASWATFEQAFRGWRSAVEQIGIFVFVLPLGQDSVRGFSIWDDRAPVVVVNSAWNVAARIFTLFHEIAHLVTRTDSACLGYSMSGGSSKDVALERWCEQFAASLLIPSEEMRAYLSKRLGWSAGKLCDLDAAGKVARRFRVSLRASVIALVGAGATKRSLIASVPESTEAKVRAGGSRPRNREEISEGRLGDRTWRMFHRAIREDLISRADAMTYLDVVDRDPSASLSDG